MARNTEPRYELTLSCGDTQSSNTAPEWGAYRRCMHCETRQRVVRVTDTESAFGSAQAARALQEHASQYAARSMPRDSSLAYAHDVGNFRSALQHIRSVATKAIAEGMATDTGHSLDRLKWIQQVAHDSLAMAQTRPGPDDDEGHSYDVASDD